MCDVYHHNLKSSFNNPCDSKLTNIALLRDVKRNGKQKLIGQQDLWEEAVCLPYGNGFVLISMLHGSERINIKYYL